MLILEQGIKMSSSGLLSSSAARNLEKEFQIPAEFFSYKVLGSKLRRQSGMMLC